MMYGLFNNYEGWGTGNIMGRLGGGIMMIVFLVLFIIFIAWIIREIKDGNSRLNSNALVILKRRYASGEISKKEFESKKKDLKR